MRAVALSVASCLVLLLALVAPAPAQSPALCQCYCGKYTYPPCSEQACKDACGYGSGQGSGNYSSKPAQVWYCRASAPDGAWGWAHSSSEAWARQAALNECRKRASGCTLEPCRINDPSLSLAPAITPRPAPGQGQASPDQAWCELCTRKLQNDIYSGWASALVRSYVEQAIAGYENCRRRVGGACPTGDAMVKDLRRCSSKFFNEYRYCLSVAAQLSGE